jgi:hypothetical protein
MSETFYAYRTVSRDCPIRPHALLRLAAAGNNAAMQSEPPTTDPSKRKRRWFQFSLRMAIRD